MKPEQELTVLYGQMQVCKIALASAQSRAEITAQREDYAKRIADILEATRIVCRDLSKELGL